MSKTRRFDGERVAEEMRLRGLSDTDVGASMGVTARSVSNYRAGSEPRGYEKLKALASLLGLQIPDLFTEGGEL